MDNPSVPSRPGQPDPAAITLGTGWLMPAAIVTFVLATGYLPAHAKGAPGFGALLALVATLYAAGLVIAAPRLARSAILRLAGRPFRVVLLGAGDDALTDPGVAGRWRLLAIATGGAVSLLVLLAALRLASVVSVDAYPHALAAVAASVALLSALGTLVPAPPFVGWSLLLTVLDLTGATPRARIRRAARAGRLVATPAIAAAAALGTLLDPWMAIPLGLLAVAHVWHATTLEVGRDSLQRFLEAHTVGDLARPPLLRVRPDDIIATATLGGRGARGAVFVEDDRSLVGAIGTRRLIRTLGDRRAGVAWRTSMVPVAQLPWRRRNEPAGCVIEALHASGVVLVLNERETWAIEEDDLFDQAAAWVRATDPPGRQHASGATRASRVSSDTGPHCQQPIRDGLRSLSRTPQARLIRVLQDVLMRGRMA